MFFSVLYRTPSFNHTSPKFQEFLSNFENLYSKIKTKNSFTIYVTGDFNAHSQFWCPDGDTTLEGTQIEELFTKLVYLNLSQSQQILNLTRTPHVLI
jgi:hypothetical protein